MYVLVCERVLPSYRCACVCLPRFELTKRCNSSNGNRFLERTSLAAFTGEPFPELLGENVIYKVLCIVIINIFNILIF